MPIRTQILRLMSVVAVPLALSGCDAAPVLEPAGEALLAKGTQELTTEEWLKRVHQVSSRFHSPTQAEKSGYAIDHACVAVPEIGGMGQHWVNMNLVDPIFDPLQPEVVLYAPDVDGKPRLVALEYIVIDAGQGQPSFGSQVFDVGGTPVPVPHWSLHVWLYEENPSGTFAPFNPNVECH